MAAHVSGLARASAAATCALVLVLVVRQASDWLAAGLQHRQGRSPVLPHARNSQLGFADLSIRQTAAQQLAASQPAYHQVRLDLPGCDQRVYINIVGSCGKRGWHAAAEPTQELTMSVERALDLVIW